jgi:hypothetical protein
MFCTKWSANVTPRWTLVPSRRRGCGDAGNAQRFPYLHAPLASATLLVVPVACTGVITTKDFRFLRFLMVFSNDMLKTLGAQPRRIRDPAPC